MDIESKLKAVFSEVFNVQPSAVGLHTQQNNLDEWDSLGQLRLMMGVEEAFDISFSIDEIAILTDFEAILNKISQKLSIR